MKVLLCSVFCTATWAQGVFPPTVDIKAYGALCDGSTDDTTAITNAIAAAASLRHERVYVPASSRGCVVSATSGSALSITTSGIELLGDGQGKSLIVLESGLTLTGDVNVIGVRGASNVQIHDLSVTVGTGYAGAHDVYLVSVSFGSFRPRIHDVELYGGYHGGPGQGGAAISLYQPWNQTEYNTTLGTAVAAPGSVQCTPPSMAGIYVGRRLVIGGTEEDVVVTAVTATTFTATFVNTHPGADTVTIYAQMKQYATVEENYIHDVPAQGILPNSAANVIRKNRLIHIGLDTGMHGIYEQAWANIIDSNYIEGTYGACVKVGGASGTGDDSDNEIVNNSLINCGTSAITIDDQNISGSGTNLDLPGGISVTRTASIMGNAIRKMEGAGSTDGCASPAVAAHSGGFLGAASVTISGNIFEDASGSCNVAWLSMSGSAKQMTASNNSFRTLTSAPSGGYLMEVNDAVISGNQIYWGGTASVIQAYGNTKIASNYISATNTNSGGAVVVAIDNNIEIANNYFTMKGVAVSDFGGTRSGLIVHDNRFVPSNTNPILDLGNRSGIYIDNDLGGGTVKYDGANSGLFFSGNYNGKVSYLANAAATTLDSVFGRLLDLSKGTNTIVNGLLVGLDVSGHAVNLGTSDTVFLGIAISSATSTVGGIYVAGQPGTVFDGVVTDGAWTAGNIGIASRTVAGKIHDSGVRTAPVSGSYVLFLDSGGTAGNARVLVVKGL